MNFLAHVYLSGPDTHVRVGNFIGDFVKGAQLDTYPNGIRTGILLHRFIDHYTDTHPVVTQSKTRLRPAFRHYAPVIVDVFYDHFLAKDWQVYSEVPLEDFTQTFYEQIHGFRPIIPDQAAHMLTYMRRDNWLLNYRLKEGIHKALSGMARRTPYDSKMEIAVQHLEMDYDAFAEEFHTFFPDLQEQARKHLEELSK